LVFLIDFVFKTGLSHGAGMNGLSIFLKFKVHDSKAFRRLSGGRCYAINAFFLQGLMVCIGLSL